MPFLQQVCSYCYWSGRQNAITLLEKLPMSRTWTTLAVVVRRKNGNKHVLMHRTIAPRILAIAISVDILLNSRSSACTSNVAARSLPLSCCRCRTNNDGWVVGLRWCSCAYKLYPFRKHPLMLIGCYYTYTYKVNKAYIYIYIYIGQIIAWCPCVTCVLARVRAYVYECAYIILSYQSVRLQGR